MCWTVFLRNLNCVMLGLVFAHLWTLSMQQGDCDFDTTLCGYQQDNTDDFDWTRQQGSTATPNTGPSSDHTSGSGYYMYIETSSQARGDVARLISPSLSNNIRCLEFWYHMYGDSTDDLRVYTRPTGSSFPKDLIWSQTGDKGDVWQRARVHIEEDSDFKIEFEGERGTSYRGDIAIDDVSFRTKPCGGGCNFETTLCGYQQDNTDDFEWTRKQGSTGSSGTGPSSDHTTGSGFYMYIEATGQQPGDVARLTSPVLSSDSRCVEFWYHMYGDNTEELRVYQSSTDHDSSQLGTPIWSLTGDQGDVWYNATVDIAAGSNLYIVFEGVRGSGFRGDIAIDDVSVRTTSCGGSIETTTATAVVTPTTIDESTTYPATTAAETTASLQVTTPAPATQRATTEGVTTLGVTTTEAVPSERDCNFDDRNVCGYQQDDTDDFDWSRKYGSSGTTGTGPSSDHTGNGYYMYIETSSPRTQGDVARLMTPALPTNTKCLEFWYHMYGSTIGQLNIYQTPTDSSQLGTPIWSLSGEQGDAWIRARLNIVADKNFHIVFEGIRGSGITGDIAIDDVSFRSTPCPDPPGDESCDFDSSLCGYQQDNTDDFDWRRQQGSTLTDDTGPSSDHTSGSGYYMYIETSSPQQPGDVARLTSPSLSTDSRCLDFWYHMYGDSTEELRVYIRFTGSADLGTPIWTETGDQGDVWLQATVDLMADRNFYVVFEGVRGTSFRGDIAIDDISFRTTSCVVTTVATPTTTVATTVPSTTTDMATTTPMTTEATTTSPLQITTYEPSTAYAITTTPATTSTSITTDMVTTDTVTTAATTTTPLRTTYKPSTEGTTTSFEPSATFMETTLSATTDMVTTDMVTTDMVTTDTVTTDMVSTTPVTTAAITTTPLQTTTYELSTEGTTSTLEPSTTYLKTTTSITTQETTQEYATTSPPTTTTDAITRSTQQAFMTPEPTSTPAVTTDATTLEHTTESETTSAVPTTIPTTQQTSFPDVEPTATLEETTKDLSTLSPTTVEATTTVTTDKDTTHVAPTAPQIAISSVTTISQSTVAKETTTASHVPSTASTDVTTTQPPDTTSLSTTKQPQIRTTKPSTTKPDEATRTTTKPGPTKPSTGKPTTGKAPPCGKDCTTVPDYKVTGKSEAQGGLSIGIIVGAGAGGAVVVILVVVIIIVAVKCRRSNTNRQKDSEWEVANPMYDVSMGPTKNGNNNNKKGGKTDDDFYTFNMDTSNV